MIFAKHTVGSLPSIWRISDFFSKPEIPLFDKAYIKFDFLYDLTQSGVFWVGRAKDNMVYRTVEQHSDPKGNIWCDEVIELTGPSVRKDYPKRMRLVEAEVEVIWTPFFRQEVYLC